MTEPVIELRDLHKLSVRGVDLVVRTGERIAVIGRTGEGKSVLLKCILGLLKPEAGEISVLCQRVVGRPVHADGLGVAFQSPGLFDTWSVAENLRVAQHLDDGQLKDLLASVDLDNIPLESSVTQLSGGQQKRLALLRALLRGTKLVVLDEPTSGLDPETASRIAGMLFRALDGTHRSLLLVTHDYETANRLCDRIVVLTGDGKLEELRIDGSTPDVAIDAMRDALSDSTIGRAVLPTRPPLRWGFLPLTSDFLRLGIPTAAIAMSLMGAMLVAQAAGRMPIDISSHIPEALVLAVFREMAPLLVGLLLASRVATRIGAELAGMSYTSQLDSMRLLGLSPGKLLLRPFMLSACAVFPLVILLGAAAALIAGALYAELPIAGLSIGTMRFIDLALDGFDPMLPVSCITKGLLMAILVVVAAYRCGTRPISSAQALGAAVTRAGAIGAAAIIGVDVALSWAFFSQQR